MKSKIKPIISIIIPTYNSEKFIFKCVNSIPIDKRVEVIIIDDCSKNNLKNKIKHKKFKNFKIFRNKLNVGPGPSRNIGIKKAKGEYILFLDSDDFLKKRNIIKFLQNYKDNKIDLYFCRYNKDHFPKDNLFFLKSLPNIITRHEFIKKYCLKIIL